MESAQSIAYSTEHDRLITADDPPVSLAPSPKLSIDKKLDHLTVVGTGQVVSARRQRPMAGDRERAIHCVDHKTGSGYSGVEPAVVPIIAVAQAE